MEQLFEQSLGASACLSSMAILRPNGLIRRPGPGRGVSRPVELPSAEYPACLVMWLPPRGRRAVPPTLRGNRDSRRSSGSIAEPDQPRFRALPLTSRELRRLRRAGGVGLAAVNSDLERFDGQLSTL